MSFERISLRSRLAFCRSTIACAVVTVGILAVSTSEARGDEGEVDFRREVLPLLSNRCFRCHGPDEGTREGGLRLDLEDAAKDPSRKSPAIVPGDPSRSEILRRIVSTDPSERMPPPEAGDPLSPEEAAIIERWIAAGAPWSGHWAFEPVVRVEPPAVRDESWVESPIDRFILARLEAEGIAPSPRADRATLIRRLYIDLLGLPPAPEDVDEFVHDDRPFAWERLVDRLLGDPHYGERQARHWLDAARYADSHGYSIDGPRTMWPWRDWVIRAFNEDMPFDEFTIKQLAGDLLPGGTLDDLVATGFHRNTLINQEGGSDPEQFRVESIIDRVDTTGAVWLGLTLECARCHTHKFDPISQREYFEIYAFFDNAQDRNGSSPTVEVPASPAFERADRAWREAVDALREFDKAHPERAKAKDDPERKTLAGEVSRRERERRRHVVEAMVIRERDGKPRTTRVHIRGDFLREGDEVSPGVPQVLPALEIAGEGRLTRLDLARWLVRDDHPLTPRVLVNRMWMRLFGRGLVETENDFGRQGSPPTHPELLDWLASELVRLDWSQKRLQREILLSATYRQSSHRRPELDRIDARNLLLARQSRFRVTAEIVRDIGLGASGLLTREIGGPSVYPPQPDGVFDFTQVKRTWKASEGADRFRRGLYTFLWRSAPHPFLSTFDLPELQETCTRRQRSNTPLQALTLANDEAVIEFARALARRALAERGPDSKAVIARMLRLGVGRAPEAEEIARLDEFRVSQEELWRGDLDAALDVAPYAARDDAAAAAAWVATARVILNLDELVTRE